MNRYNCANDRTDVPEGLEARLEALIDRLDESEKRKRRKTVRVRLVAGYAAAGLILALVAARFLPQSENDGELLKPEMQEQNTMLSSADCLETQRDLTLILVSSVLNGGLSQLDIVAETIGKSQQILSETLNNIK